MRIFFLWGLVGCAPPPTGGLPVLAQVSPALDCDALVSRISACADDFQARYAQTEDAARRGAPAPGAPGNGEEGAKTLLRVFRDPAHRPLADQHCAEAWAMRDPPWRKRLDACGVQQECGPWAACAASAIGDPLLPADAGSGDKP